MNARITSPPAAHYRQWTLRGKRAFSAVVLLALAAGGGCSRAYYRTQADAEDYSLIQQKASDPRWELPNFSIEPSPESRFADPYNPDYQPMPPDDPTAHELMHYVDGMKNSKHWHDNGDTPYVDNPDWQAFLPRNDKGQVVLDLQGAVATSLINSREYQTENENLYLAALDVSLERFAFDTQFYGGTSMFFTSDGMGDSPASSQLELNVFDPANRLRATRLYATGGQLLVGLANSFVWEFSGPNSESTFTILDLGFIQPLLRGAGRAVVLNNLTTSERELLAQVRALVRFRHEFYAQIATGRGSSAGGYLGLLESIQQIRNQEATVASLRQSLTQLKVLFYDLGRIDRLQVDQAQSRLYEEESRLLAQRAALQSSLDQYKFELGLPPDLPLELDDSLIAQFDLIDPALRTQQEEIDRLLNRVRESGPTISPQVFQEAKKQAAELAERRAALIQMVEADYQRLLDSLPQRREALERLVQRPEVRRGDLTKDPFRITDLEERVKKLHVDLDLLLPKLNQQWSELDRIERIDPATLEENEQQPLVDGLTKISRSWLELSLLQARARLDTVVIRPVELDDRRAFEIALENRLDLMNQRSQLVDVWRQIRVTANALKSGLDVTFDGDISTTGNNPLRFRDKTGRMRVGFQFDAPLTRLIERNDYRAALIEYQQARRQFMAYVDGIDQSLRDSLRSLNFNELNLEVSRAGVLSAIAQVEITQLQLEEPPRDVERQPTSNTTSRDLTDALRSLLVAQNTFLADWINHETERVNLDVDLGTMRLDGRGMWIDPGADIGQVSTDESLWQHGQGELVPAPHGQPTPHGELVPRGDEHENTGEELPPLSEDTQRPAVEPSEELRPKTTSLPSSVLVSPSDDPSEVRRLPPVILTSGEVTALEKHDEAP